MSRTIVERLTRLRILMRSKGIDAFLVNGTDPHLSEYVQPRYQTRSYISGFTGSYGWLAITQEEAVLWTDSRYYLQAEQQLNGTGIAMEKARIADTIPTEIWVSSRLETDQTVAFDGLCYPVGEVKRFISHFRKKGININTDTDLINEIWTDRPGLPESKVIDHPVEYAGVGRNEKLKKL